MNKIIAVVFALLVGFGVASAQQITPIGCIISGGTITCGGSSLSTGLTVGTTTISSGTTARILYDNAGVLGEYTLTGTGTVVVMQTSPTLITPVLGVATGTSLALNGATLGVNVFSVNGLMWLGGGATNLFPAADGTPGSTQVDNMWRVNLANLNVGTFQNLSNTGYSAIRFADDAGAEHGAVGWGNSGVSSTWQSLVYLESFLPSASGTATGALAPIRLIQSNSNTHSIAYEVNSSRETIIAGLQPVSSVGNVLGIRANSSNYAGNATSNSSIVRLEQLGNRNVLTLYQPQSGGAAYTATDGHFRDHIEHTSSTGPNVVLRNDGSGDWLQGQAASSATVIFAMGPTKGIVFSGDTTFSRNAAGVAQIGTTAANALGSLLLVGLTGTGNVSVTGSSSVIITKSYTVGGLPASPGTGARAHVTDQLTTCAAIGVALTGGGAVTCPAFYNGSAWVGG